MSDSKASSVNSLHHNYTAQHLFVKSIHKLGGGTPIYPVLRSLSAIRNLDQNNYHDIALILRLWVLSLKFCLTLTNLTV